MMAWHFCNIGPVGPVLRDGQPLPAPGVELRHDGPLVLCSSGLHASRLLYDALEYAPGPYICRVRLGGTIIRDKDKVVATSRTVLWGYDATAVLRRFARAQALSVAHMWDAPPVVLQWLRTGDESLRVRARAAAAWSSEAAEAAALAAALAALAAALAAEAAAWPAAARAAARSAAWSAAARSADATMVPNRQLTQMVIHAPERKASNG